MTATQWNIFCEEEPEVATDIDCATAAEFMDDTSISEIFEMVIKAAPTSSLAQRIQTARLAGMLAHHLSAETSDR